MAKNTRRSFLTGAAATDFSAPTIISLKGAEVIPGFEQAETDVDETQVREL